MKTALENMFEKFNELVSAVEVHLNESECLIFVEELGYYPSLLSALRMLGIELCRFRYCYNFGCSDELNSCLRNVEEMYEKLSAEVGKKMAICNL